MKAQKNASARSEAIDLLTRVERDAAFVGRIGSASKLSPSDLRRRSEYVGGVTRWRAWLDFLIVQFSGRPLSKIDAPVVQILRLGIYELLFMRTPAHAAINEAVELAKSVSKRSAGGFVNAILRRVDRERDTLPQPDTGNASRDLATRYSHPG